MSPIPAIISLLLLVSSITAASRPTVYEVIESYGFPAGLLPQGVIDYELDSETGKFTVYLNKTCSFRIQGYSLRYSTKITGKISPGKISNLSGIKVKVLLFWVTISEVTIDGTDLELSVGIASADFPVDNFSDSPQCGCGFDCVNENRRWRFGINRFFPVLEI